jgi:serine/threonine protein kinase
MSGNEVAIAFNRALHQSLPTPLAHAYRKAYNSPTPKELHDNALQFGLCVLRFAAAAGMALMRQLRLPLNREEIELLDKLDRPSEGDFHRWLGRAMVRMRESQPAPDSLDAALDAYLNRKRNSTQSELPAAFGQLVSQLDNKVVVRKDANAYDFLLVLVRYRNYIAHGAGLREELNQVHGEAILRGATELAATLPLADGWELAYTAKSSLGPTAVDCQMVHLTGPDWLRGAPLSFPRGFPAPLAGHVVLLAKPDGARHVDLHPLVIFHHERVLFFSSLRGKSPEYLDYDTAEKTTVQDFGAEYSEWKNHFGTTTGESSAGGDEPAEDRPAAQTLPSPEQRFRFERLLGRGGMGEVWLAYDEVLRRPVAIKRVRGELLGSGKIDRRFLQEARDAARLSHPNIVQILSVDSDSQGPYLVLEYMEGASLRQLLQNGPLQLPVALAYLRQILQALQHAHEHGLVHRDVKPENILLTKAGIPKLADFGLAWLHDEDEPDAPREESLGEGTRLYMAPELRGGASPTAQTDLFALGMTFYEMLTGRPPQAIDDRKVPSTAAPLIRRLSHADPNFRYDTAQAALHDCQELERALELAGRTQEETTRRIVKTAEQSLELLSDSRLVDAQAGFQRILAEDPDNVRAQTGLLLGHLASGDMEQAAARFRALAAAEADDPVFARFRAFIEGIRAPTVLRMTPQPSPFSYRIADLRRGQFVKELIELSAETINLGDVGEVLVELCQKQPGRRAEHELFSAAHHVLRFDLGAVQVEASFLFQIKPKAFFLPPRLLASDVALSIAAEPFEIYRFARYLTYILAQRFKRPVGDLVHQQTAGRFGYDPRAMQESWERLNCNVRQLILVAPK